jgi:hypothetical protein
MPFASPNTPDDFLPRKPKPILVGKYRAFGKHQYFHFLSGAYL